MRSVHSAPVESTLEHERYQEQSVHSGQSARAHGFVLRQRRSTTATIKSEREDAAGLLSLGTSRTSIKRASVRPLSPATAIAAISPTVKKDSTAFDTSQRLCSADCTSLKRLEVNLFMPRPDRSWGGACAYRDATAAHSGL